MKKRAQAWYVDFMVGLLIFLLAIGAYYIYQGSLSEEVDYTLNDMVAESKGISISLMSPGFPADWTPADVEKIGITDGTTRVDYDKLGYFSQLDYNLTRSLFGTSYEYVVYFFDGNETIIMPINQTYIGKLPTNHRNLVKITRTVIYNSTVAQLEVRLWQ